MDQKQIAMTDDTRKRIALAYLSDEIFKLKRDEHGSFRATFSVANGRIVHVKHKPCDDAEISVRL